VSRVPHMQHSSVTGRIYAGVLCHGSHICSSRVSRVAYMQESSVTGPTYAAVECHGSHICRSPVSPGTEIQSMGSARRSTSGVSRGSNKETGHYVF
jgi:hypothetical protein